MIIRYKTISWNLNWHLLKTMANAFPWKVLWIQVFRLEVCFQVLTSSNTDLQLRKNGFYGSIITNGTHNSLNLYWIWNHECSCCSKQKRKKESSWFYYMKHHHEYVKMVSWRHIKYIRTINSELFTVQPSRFVMKIFSHWQHIIILGTLYLLHT